MIKKVLLSILIVFVVLIVAAVTFLDKIIEGAINKAGPSLVGVPVSVEDVTISPFTGFAKIKNFRVGNPEGFNTENLLYIDEFMVKLNLRSLFTDHILIEDIVVSDARVTYEKGLRSSNVSTLLEQFETEPSEDPAVVDESEAPAVEKTVEITHLLADKVGVSLSLTVLGGKSMNLTLPTIERSDIGKDGGLSTQQLVKNFFSQLNDVLVDAVKGVGGAGVDGVKGVTGAAASGVMGSLGSLKSGLFGDSVEDKDDSDK